MENNKPNINLLEHADQDNDLVNFLRNFRTYWDRYGQQILWTVLILLLVIAGIRWWNYREAAAHEDAWSSLATATSPEAYQTLARLVDRDSVKALALLRGADLLLQEAVSPTDSADPMAEQNDPANAGMGPEGSGLEAPGLAGATADEPVDPQEALASAASMYQQVLDIPNVHRLFRINAHAGLANVSESQGEWKNARANWQQVVDLAGDDYSMIRLRAKARLTMVDELQQPVRFGESPQTGLEAGPSMPGGTAVPGLAPGGQFEFVPEEAGEEGSAITPPPAAVPDLPEDVEAPETPAVQTETPAIPADPDAPAEGQATDEGE